MENYRANPHHFQPERSKDASVMSKAQLAYLRLQGIDPKDLSVQTGRRGRIIGIQIHSPSVDSVDTSKFPHLRVLEMYHNCLQFLDVSQNSELRSLVIGRSHLKQLDLSQNTKLEVLRILPHEGVASPTQLVLPNSITILELANIRQPIDLQAIRGLTYLGLRASDLSLVADLQSYLMTLSNLQALDVSHSQASELSLLNHPSLQSFHGKSAVIPIINLSGCSQLQQIEIDHSSTRQLLVDNCEGLTTLIASFSSLAELDVTQCPTLKILELNQSKVTELDLSHNTQLHPSRVLLGGQS